MRHFITDSIVILMMASIPLSCTVVDKRDPPVTPSDILNEWVRSAPHQYLDLDLLDAEVITPVEEDFYFSTFLNPDQGEPLIGHLNSFIKTESSFYVYDGRSRAIYRINQDRTVEGPLTREGQGPGEHQIVGKLGIDDQFIYATDLNNARINRYSYDLTPAGHLSNFVSGFEDFDVSNGRIYTMNRNSAVPTPLYPEQGLITVLAASDLSDTLATFMPRIVPAGHQPFTFNRPRFSVKRDRLIAAYTPLPWIFLSNEEYELERTLILEFARFEEMNLIPMEFFLPVGSEGFGGANPLRALKLLEGGEIFISIGRDLFRMTRESTASYKLRGRYQFVNPFGEQGIYPTDIFSGKQPNEYFIGSSDHLFRAVLPM